MRWTGQRQQWRRIPVFVTCVSLKWNAAHAENEEDRFNGGMGATQRCSLPGNRPGPHAGGLLSKRSCSHCEDEGILGLSLCYFNNPKRPGNQAPAGTAL